MYRRLKNFSEDESGTILVFVAMCLVLFLALAAITFDLGRVSATQTDLQSYVDHVALAAAGELDGEDDAITRATAAAEEMIRDRQTFADGSQLLGSTVDYSLRFLSGLPDDDYDLTARSSTDVGAFVVDTSRQNAGREARLVEVTATPRTVFTPFANATSVFFGSTHPSSDVGAVAIAGFTSYACDISPLMFCLPSGDYKANDNIGHTIRMRTGGNNALWQPGNFGFLLPEAEVVPDGPCDGENGANLKACQIAAAGNISQCFSTRGVDTEPGQKQGLNAAVFNTRLDIFEATMNKRSNDWRYAPGPHVVKGKSVKNNCSISKDESPDTMAFPADGCMQAGTCADGPRFGDGNWDINSYLEMNHGTQTTNADGDVVTTVPEPFASMMTALPGTRPDHTRYDVYLEEIANADATNYDGILPIGRSESGLPQCNTAVPPDNKPYGPERRVLIAAGIDCDSNPISGRATDVPVKEFFKVFMLGPSRDLSNKNDFVIDVEILGSAGGAGGGNSELFGVFREVVEIYR